MEISNIVQWKIDGQEVIQVVINNQIFWKKQEQPPVECKAFYIQDASGADNTLTLTKSNENAPDIKLEFSNDGQQWQEWINCHTTALPIKANEKVYLRGTNQTFCNIQNNAYLFNDCFNCSGNFNIGGDVTTLLDPNGNVLDLTGRDDCFYSLFGKSTTLQNAKDLVFPSTTLAKGCYYGMFMECSSLLNAPVLPATTLAPSCYLNMFEDCTSLVDAPTLPATMLVKDSYNGMFRGCTSLVDAPTLPATQLAESCYKWMFSGCSSLVNAPTLPATMLVKDCYYNMFKGCSSLVDAPTLSATQLASYCCDGMFFGCTSLVNVPALTATQLADFCYNDMFGNCTSLVTAPELPATQLVNYCYNGMFKDCTNLSEVKVGATNWDEKNTSDWLLNVNATGNIVAPNLSVADFPISASGVPEGWTVNNEKPVIPIEPFYIQDASGAENSLTLTKTGEAPDVKLEYSNDNKVWQEWVNCQTTSLSVAPNSKVYLRGSNNTIGKSWDNYNSFNCSGNFNIGGDITTLLVPDGNVLDLTGRNYIFTMLFNTTKVVDASKLILPSTILADYCYNGMFQDCLSLVTAPELPATTLAPYCYFGMFNGCASLTTTPTLPATTLVHYCYFGMFKSCTSLVNAPELPATTLVGNCYIEMFRYCKSLIKIEIGATTWNKNYAKNWLQGVAQVGTFIKPKELTNIPNGTYGIPLEWEVINK